MKLTVVVTITVANKLASVKDLTGVLGPFRRYKQTHLGVYTGDTRKLTQFDVAEWDNNFDTPTQLCSVIRKLTFWIFCKCFGESQLQIRKPR